MKYCLILLIVMLAFSKLSFGQNEDTIRLKKTYEERKRMIVTDRPPQAWYFGLGGSGIIVSANYDRRFKKQPGGAGFTAGVGLWFGAGSTIFTFPASLNYLFGKRNSFFELAAGPTLVTGSFDFGSSNQTVDATVIWHMNAGFRYQPAAGGFLFRAGFCPLFARDFSFLFYYIGGGIAF